MFGLCECHKGQVFTHLVAGKKIQAIKVLKNCTGLGVKDAKGIIDIMQEWQKLKQSKSLFTLTEDMLLQDDVTAIYEQNPDKPGICTSHNTGNQLTKVYERLYDHLTDEEKERVHEEIYPNMLFHVSIAFYDAMNSILDIPNYLGISDKD